MLVPVTQISGARVEATHFFALGSRGSSVGLCLYYSAGSVGGKLFPRFWLTGPPSALPSLLSHTQPQQEWELKASGSKTNLPLLPFQGGREPDSGKCREEGETPRLHPDWDCFSSKMNVCFHILIMPKRGYV